MYDNESHLIDVDPQRIYRHSPKFKILENTLPYGVCLWAYQLQLDTHKTRMTMGGLGNLAFARWAGWFSGQVGRHVNC